MNIPELQDALEPNTFGDKYANSVLVEIVDPVRMLDPELEGASKKDWTLIDFVKKRRRQGEVKKAKKEKGQELRIIRTIERRRSTVSRPRTSGKSSISRWTAARRRP